MTTLDAYDIRQAETHLPRAWFRPRGLGRVATGVSVVALSAALWVLIGLAAWTLLSVWS